MAVLKSKVTLRVPQQSTHATVVFLSLEPLVEYVALMEHGVESHQHAKVN